MYTFIDTNVFYENKFNFQSKTLTLLVSLIENKELNLITTDLQVKELEKKVVDLVNNKYTYDKKGEQIKELITTPEQEEELAKLKESIASFKTNLISYYTNVCDSFLKRSAAKFLITNEIKPMEAFHYFFSIKAPFTEKKRNEYRDTFMLLNLKEYALTNKVPVNVISKDDGVKLFCDEFDELIYYSEVEEYTNALNKHKENYDKVHEALHDHNVIDQICTKILRIPFNTDLFRIMYGGRIEGVKVLAVPYPDNLDFQIVSMDDTAYQTRINAKFTTEITFIVKGKELNLNTFQMDPTNQGNHETYTPFRTRVTEEVPFNVSITFKEENHELVLNSLEVTHMLENPIDLNSTYTSLLLNNLRTLDNENN